MTPPQSIREMFKPFETIGPADNRYEARPQFVPYPTNYLRGWSFIQEHKSTDGTDWLVRSYSPSNRQGKEFGTFDVIYCRSIPSLEKVLSNDRDETLNLDSDGTVTDKITQQVLTQCECDNTHQNNDTCCRWCWAYGRRHWNDPEIPTETNENQPTD